MARDGNAGYRTLARLREAALKADGGDAAGAEALWTQVANDAAADRLLRDAAVLQSVLHQIDTGDPAALAARLKPLAAPDNPWHALAEEAQALLDLRQGHTRCGARHAEAPGAGRDRAGRRARRAPTACWHGSADERRDRQAGGACRAGPRCCCRRVLGGCSLFDSWFGDNKPPLPGTRVAVMNPRRGLEVDDQDAHVVLPPPVANADWPQAGGNAVACHGPSAGARRAGHRLAVGHRRGRRLPPQDHRPAGGGRRAGVHHGQRRAW